MQHLDRSGAWPSYIYDARFLKVKKDKNQTIALAVGMQRQSGMGSRDPALKTAGCASRDKMVYWRCSSNISGYQLFEH
jgi:hypothetical protein